MKERLKLKIFKPIKDLDIEIRTITEELNDNKTIFYVCEVGLYESLGEQGEICTLIYDRYPQEKEIIERVKIILKETKEDLSNSILSAREESYLKILNKVV